MSQVAVCESRFNPGNRNPLHKDIIPGYDKNSLTYVGWSVAIYMNKPLYFFVDRFYAPATCFQILLRWFFIKMRPRVIQTPVHLVPVGGTG